MESFLEDVSGYSDDNTVMNLISQPKVQPNQQSFSIVRNIMSEYDSVETIEKDFLKCCEYEFDDIIRAANNIAKKSRRGLGNHLIMNYKSLFMLSDKELRWLGIDLDLDEIKNPKDREMLYKLSYDESNSKRTIHFRNWIDIGEIYVCYRGGTYDSIGVYSYKNGKVLGFIDTKLAPNYINKVIKGI